MQGPSDALPIVRSLLLYAERVLYLPEALYDIILILRFYVFQGGSKSSISVQQRFAKKWLTSEPSIHGKIHGKVLDDLVCVMLIVMREHPQDYAVQTLSMEAIDKISLTYKDETLFTIDPSGHRCIARDVAANHRCITKAEAASIMENAALRIRIRGSCLRDYAIQSVYMRSFLFRNLGLAGPFPQAEIYPCNDIPTRAFFGKWEDPKPVMWARWMKWNNPKRMYRVVRDISELRVGDVVELPDMPSSFSFRQSIMWIRVVSTGKLTTAETDRFSNFFEKYNV